MPEIYDSQLKARLTVDEQDRVRGINHVDEYWESPENTAKETAIAYLREVADTFTVPSEQFAFAHQQVDYLHPEIDRDTEYRSSEEKTFFDGTTEAFYQTHRNVPVWAAGVAVQIKHSPMRVLGATDTSIDGVDAELPSEEVIDRWRNVIRQAAAEKPAEGFAADADESATAGLVGDLVAGRAFKRSNRRATTADREAARGARILSGRFFIYRYDPDQRLETPEKPAEPPPPVIGLTGEEEAGFQSPERVPTLPLPPVDRRIRAGGDYLVAELVFRYVTPEWGDINWRALVEVETGSILYLRALAAEVNGLIFRHDPISESGNNANGPAANAATLNMFQDDVVLPNLNAPAGGTQSLAGSRVTLSDIEPVSPLAAPTQGSGVDFDYGSRTNEFAAVNAYYHVDRFFKLVEDLGFPLATYFGGTTFPVPTDHRGFSGVGINAHCVGTGSGIAHLCYALADLGDTANPIGIATDWRVHLHELGGHGILHDHVGGPNFGFSHSAGDSMAVILVDPESVAPDRFLLAPFVPVIVRRHDRPVSSWGWDGANDVGGYSSEQVLSTTLFRAYRSIGGDAADVGRRRFAARYMAYLILRTVGTLTPLNNPGHARPFANAMILADAENWTSEGLFGGAYGKVIRWAFEKQGLRFDTPFPAKGTVTTVGPPPAVDVYIDDGRAGEYPFQPVHWNTTTIWNRKKPDGGLTHQTPKLHKKNYAYVKIKNRGTQTANNVIVRGFHTKPAAGLLWPNDFEAFTTPQLSAGTLGANNSEEKIVGPFEWQPNVNAYGHDCMLMIVSATSDASNIDNFTAGEVIPEWRLVPNDNNIGQRNVNLIPGGGGGGSMMEGLHGFPLWVGNPNPKRAVIDIEVKLPAILVERGWTIGFAGLRSNRFTLRSREQRELTIEVQPGAPFERADVESSDDRDIEINVSADGGPLGGMVYRVDPTLDRAEDRPGAAPGGPDTKRCIEHATDLLECLDLHGHDVRSVRVKKITLEVGMEGECC